MRDSLKDSITELLDFAEGKPTDVEIRTYEIEKAPDYTGTQIRNIRKKVNVSRAVFADILDVSPRTVERWEVDGAKPNGSAKRLIQLLDSQPVTMVKIIKEISKIS